MGNGVFIDNLLPALFFAALISIISKKLNLLTKSGAAATSVLAFIIFSCGGWKWSIPILTFFILSSFLSRFRKTKNEAVETFFEKSGDRDYLQVIANGGAAGIIMIMGYVYNNELFYWMYVSSIAAACADTWGTETGNLRKATTINIVSFKKQQQGTSGGISVPGTLGSILGGTVIAFSALYWADNRYLYYICIVVLAGLTGSIIDSILGAVFQNKNRCTECDTITERKVHCGMKARHYKGIKYLNNDAVNFISSSAGGLTVLLLIKFL